MTRADRIREMTDEEMAKFLCYMNDGSGLCAGCVAEQYCYLDHNGMIDWLQKDGDVYDEE